LALVGLLILLASGCENKDNNKPSTDTTPPVTAADPPGGTHGSIIYVTLTSNEPATVYFTKNGREPTVSDNDGSGPSPFAGIGIVTKTTLKFFAVDAAGNVEPVKTQTYVIGTGPDVTPPTTAADPAGGTYNPPVSVTLMPDEPATTYYTTDGSTPDTGSAVYASPISLSENTTLMFFSVDAAGNEESVKTEDYMFIDSDVTPPITTADPPGGTYDSEVSVTLTPNEPATVYYTMDGSTPDTGSAVYASAISISEDTTLKFFGVDTAGNEESVKTALYTITAGDETPPITTAAPPGGTYDSAVSVTLTPNESATVYYTTDGSTPDTGSAVYASAISISEDTTLKFFGVDTAGNEESVKTALYTITAGDETPPITTAAPPGGTYDSEVSVTLTPNEPATVYYTIDGSTPGTGSAVYVSPISISEDTTLKFFGVDTAGNEEDVKTQGYIITGGGPGEVTIYGSAGRTNGATLQRDKRDGCCEAALRWFHRYDLSTVPSGANIEKVTLHLFVGRTTNDTFYFYSLENDPDTGTASSIYTDAANGTRYLTIQPANYGWKEAVLDLGGSAASDLEENLGKGWFGIGIKGTDC
jgi:hypothetical protein